MNPPPPDSRLDALQAQFALRVAATLDEQAERLPHDLGERLRVAREQAVRRARELGVVQTLEPRPVAVRAAVDGSLSLGRRGSWWVWLGSALPALVLAVGLLVIQQLHEEAEIRAAAEVDTALLADDLPPAAYRDPGFLEFLKRAEP